MTFEPTKTNAKYVIPNLRPFEAINYLCTQAISQKYNNAGYMFYENKEGFNVQTVSSPRKYLNPINGSDSPLPQPLSSPNPPNLKPDHILENMQFTNYMLY